MEPIMLFRKEFFFLSNFYPKQITYKDLTFDSSEAAYQSTKTNDYETKKKFTNISAKESKYLARTIEIRPGFHDMKLSFMYDILKIKFSNPFLRKLLLDTRDREIIEGNYHNDKYWGYCLKTNEGENWLGKLLMKLREELSNESTIIDTPPDMFNTIYDASKHYKIIEERTLFVFGSNLAGRHGRGAAKTAVEGYGADYGRGTGLQGRSYAIPTKDEHLKTLPLDRIKPHIDYLINFSHNSDYSLFITPVGSGLAGIDCKLIAKMFKGVRYSYIPDIWLPEFLI